MNEVEPKPEGKTLNQIDIDRKSVNRVGVGTFSKFAAIDAPIHSIGNDEIRHAPVSSLIRACLDAKQGNKEFILTTIDDDKWFATIGSVRSPEKDTVDFRAEGKSPEEALEKLLEKINGP